jgi:hypothetical protein
MIAEQADLLEEEEQREAEPSVGEESRVEEARGIDWIIRECHEFEKKFKVRKARSKNKKK